MQNLKYSPLTHRVAAASLFFTQGILFSAWATRIPDFKAKLNMSDADLGGLLLALPLGQLLTMVISGFLVAKFTSKRVLSIAGFILPLMLLRLAFVDSMGALFFALFLYGVTANLTNISINTQAVDVERIYKRSIMASFHGVWSFAGFFGGILTATFIAFKVDMLEHYIIVAVVSALILCCSMRFLVASDERQPEPDELKDDKPSRPFWKPTPFILILGAISFSCMSCEGSMMDWSVIFFRDVIHTAPDISRVGFISYMSAMTIGRFIADGFINRFGKLNILLTSGVLISVGMYMAVLFPNIYTGSIGFALAGFGVSSVIPTCFSIAGCSRRMNAGVAISVVSTIGFFGFLLFPPIIGYIAEVSSLKFSFALMGLIGIFVTLLAPRLKSRLNDNN